MDLLWFNFLHLGEPKLIHFFDPSFDSVEKVLSRIWMFALIWEVPRTTRQNWQQPKKPKKPPFFFVNKELLRVSRESANSPFFLCPNQFNFLSLISLVCSAANVWTKKCLFGPSVELIEGVQRNCLVVVENVPAISVIIMMKNENGNLEVWYMRCDIGYSYGACEACCLWPYVAIPAVGICKRTKDSHE